MPPSPGVGHALEAGWFLLQFSAERGDQELQRTAIDKFLEVPFKDGWDKDHGGLFYFLDVDKLCPTQVSQRSSGEVGALAPRLKRQWFFEP